MIKKTIMLISILVIGTSCVHRLGDFTLWSTRNVDVGDKYVRVATGSEGKDVVHLIFGFAFKNPNFENAVDNCLALHDGDLLTNAVLTYQGWFAIFYGQQVYKVTGDVWKKADEVSDNNINDDSYYTVNEINGQLTLINNVGDEETIFNNEETEIVDNEVSNNTAKEIVFEK